MCNKKKSFSLAWLHHFFLSYAYSFNTCFKTKGHSSAASFSTKNILSLDDWVVLLLFVIGNALLMKIDTTVKSREVACQRIRSHQVIYFRRHELAFKDNALA
jgi:hypothetical protein